MGPDVPAGFAQDPSFARFEEARPSWQVLRALMAGCSAAARRAPHGGTHYFVITPEVRTDETVHALRQGWMRSIPHERLHFCVAAGSDSAHLRREPMMLLLQGVQRSAGTPVTRDAYWHDREISASQRLALKESYNSFLRSKLRHACGHTCLCDTPPCASHHVHVPYNTTCRVPHAMCLRSKVLAMVREMAALASRSELDYAFMLDYDTVTNTWPWP